MSPRKTLALAAVPALALFASAAPAAPAPDTYPSRPIRLVVPFPPGGINDVLARILGQKLGEATHENVVIDNRPGAGGTLGATIAAKSNPDGYTLLFGATSTIAVAPNMYTRIAYDPRKDLQGVAPMATVASVVVVNPGLAAQSMKELIALARAKPGVLNYGSAGAGASQHMGAELFKTMTGTSMVHVPYKGGAPAMTDLIGGQISLMFEPLPTALVQMKAGRVRALAVTTPKRSPVLPDLPTVAETVPGYDLTIWFGVLAQAGVAKPIVSRLNTEMEKILRQPDVRERLAAQGAEPMFATPAQFDAFIQKEIERWGKVVRASGAKVE